MRPRLLLTINCKFAVDFFARGLHTCTAVARLPLRQLGFLVYTAILTKVTVLFRQFYSSMYIQISQFLKESYLMIITCKLCPNWCWGLDQRFGLMLSQQMMQWCKQCATAHCAWKTVAMLTHETSELTGPDPWPPNRTTFQTSALTVLLCYFSKLRESDLKLIFFQTYYLQT